MAIRKWSKLQLNDDAFTQQGEGSAHVRTAKLADFQFQPEPGFLYVTTRAISSRVNANYDGWPPEELRRAYMTFVGRPVYVDHNNWDLMRSRGVIIDAKLYENKLASGHEDVWVELLIEVDAQAFPKLAQSIIDNEIDAVSMGADVEYTICSVCANVAHDVLQYCAHIPQLKGKEIDTFDKQSNNRIRKLCYEDCYGVSFFEISFVFDPADESALISDVMLASKDTNRALGHIRRSKETVAAYSERLGTSMMKVASVRMPDFCTTCGSTDLAISKTGSKCRDCGFSMEADKVLMSLPQEVDTLRDELNCPQCGSEWNGMVCMNCGFELPPEGLGDPDTAPEGMNLPEGQGGNDASEEDDSAGGPPASVTDKGSDDSKDKKDDKDSDDKSKSKGDDKSKPKADDKSKSKDDGKSKDDKSKAKSDDKSKDKKDDSKSKKDDDKKKPATDKKKSGHKEEMRVSRFDDLRKQATLPVDPPYRQDAYPGTAAEPYGQSSGTGAQPEGVEQALEPAPAAPAVVQELDAPDVQAPVGQSAVTVVQQPAGPVDQAPPGPSAGEALNGAPGKAASTKEEKRGEFYRARAAALRERAEEFERKAEVVTQTDVRNLDEPPAVDLGADATIDVLKVTDEHEQLALADTPDTINDGSETGVPAVRDRLQQQVNPFNDASLRGYEGPVGGSALGSAQAATNEENGAEAQVVEEAARQAREDQRVAHAKTRVLRVANFVDQRIEMGLTRVEDKFQDIAKFEEMNDATLDGFVQATREFQAKEIRVASKRISVAPAADKGPIRMPSLGSVSASVVDEDEPADDYLTFLNAGS